MNPWVLRFPPSGTENKGLRAPDRKILTVLGRAVRRAASPLYDECSMGKCAILALALLAASSCKPPEESHSKAIIGAVLIDGAGGPPVTNSIVVLAGDRIRGVGPASAVPIPAQADKINGGGRFLVPALVPVAPNIQGRDEAALARARETAQPAIARIATLADAEWMLDHGATGFVGMILDTETFDPTFLAKLRDLRVVFAPSLSGAGANLETARRNTLRLFQAGVPIALSSDGNPLREAELLAEAGIPPLDVIVAATRNGAAALHNAASGVIQEGKRANLLLLSANPGEDIRNLGRVALRLVNGEIVN